MRRVSVSRAALHRAGLRRVALPAAGWPGGARRGASGGGGDDNPYFPAGMPQELKNSIVLWYDLERQKATNESMSLSPILKDLSGNGNDATCYNFGWSGMSGIGGYSTNFNNWIVNNSVQVEKNSIYFKLIDNTNNINNWLLFFSAANGVPSFSVRITNLIGNLKFQRYDGDVKTEIPIEGNGIFSVEEMEPTNQPIGFLGDVENGLTIELLPQYPNALVSDGVNDYCLVQDRYDDEGNLINKKSLVLNREDGYTVIAKRKWISTKRGVGFLGKRQGITQNDGAFVFEVRNINYNYCTSFGVNTINLDFPTDDFIWQTSLLYNNLELGVGSKKDTDLLCVFRPGNENTFYSSIALYSLLLFNRDLTTDEIEWVKTNLMQ